MKEYTNTQPEFAELIQVVETTDPAHADIVNTAPIQIFQNTLCNRQSIEQLRKSVVSVEAYNSEVSYQVGDYCLYQKALYKCIQNASGEWDAACWIQTDTLKEINELIYPEFDDSGKVENITDFPAFLAKVKSKMNAFEFLRDLKAGMQFVLHTGQTVNNCLSESSDLPLAAAQGKVLMDRVTELKSNFVKSGPGAKAGLVPSPGTTEGTAKYLREDGTWQVPPDTNTWRGIQNSLTSNSTTEALSAAQGKALANGSARDNTKLPLTGGTVSGAIRILPNSVNQLALFLGHNYIQWADTGSNPGCIFFAYNEQHNKRRGFTMYTRGWNTADDIYIGGIFFGDKGNSDFAIYNYQDGLYNLGYSNSRFKQLYASTGTIQTSDRNEKQEIQELDPDFIKKFIMGITPVSYMYKQNDSGRTHYGMIAQDIEDLMNELNMDSKDFAGFIKSPKEEEFIEYDQDGVPQQKTKMIAGEYRYSLRYDEFIAPLIKMVQVQQEEIEKLRDRVASLEETVNSIIKG